MEFSQPIYLYLLALLPFALGLLLFGAAARRHALGKIGDPTLVARMATVRPGSRRVRAILWLLAISMLIVAIALGWFLWSEFGEKKDQ